MMEQIFSLKNIIVDLVDKEIQHQLVNIEDGIRTCAKKMVSATKFIDFFVHDILDYTLLNNKDKNFTKNITVFDIQSSIDDVVDTLSDKC